MSENASFVEPAVVVGVDGSKAGERAAAWAVDEAVHRDLPLRLVAVAEPGGDPAATADALAAAAAAVRATGRPVRVLTEVVAGAPTLTLLEASRTAAMVCVGEVGLRLVERHRIGSTARALVASAHCPVAVVRAGSVAPPAENGWVVVELDETPHSGAVLQTAVDQARLRGAPLRVLGSWQSRLVRTQLDGRLAQWRRRYPDLDALPVAVHGSMLDWLARHAGEIQLVVVGARNADAVAELLGPTGLAALHNTDCSVLVVDPQLLL